MQLTEHFDLAEFVPPQMASGTLVPDAVLHNVTRLAVEILEPMRVAIGRPVRVHDGWRPPALNALVGGVPGSDHTTGSAADWHVDGGALEPWEEATKRAFDWVREHLDGKYGQLILEDQRAHFVKAGKLWVHVSLPTQRHPGNAGDPNRLLVSSAPRQYEPWVEGRFA